MPGIVSNQIANNAITPDKADLTTPWSFTSDNLQVSTAPTTDNDAANKAYVDSIASGLSWKEPASVKNYLGEGTVATINGLTPGSGDSVLATDAGTPTAGTSDLLAPGDIAEFNGTSWILMVPGDGTNPVADTRAIVAAAGTIGAAIGNENAIAEWPGSTNTPGFTVPVDGDAVLIIADGSVCENLAFTFDGLAWIQFTGPGTLTAGDGINITGTVISADLTPSGGLKFDTGAIRVEPADFAGVGLEDDGLDSMQLSVQGFGIGGGGGSVLTVEADSVGGAGLATVVDVNANGVAILVDDTYIYEDGSGNLSQKYVPAFDGPRTEMSALAITVTDADVVSGPFHPGETITQATSGATGTLLFHAVNGADLILYVVRDTTGAAFTTTAGHTLSGGTSGASTTSAPGALGLDTSPDGSNRAFLLTQASAIEAENDIIANTLMVTRNGVVCQLAGTGDGTGNDSVELSTADPDTYYFHTAGAAIGEIEFFVAPLNNDVIEVYYFGVAAA